MQTDTRPAPEDSSHSHTWMPARVNLIIIAKILYLLSADQNISCGFSDKYMPFVFIWFLFNLLTKHFVSHAPKQTKTCFLPYKHTASKWKNVCVVSCYVHNSLLPLLPNKPSIFTLVAKVWHGRHFLLMCVCLNCLKFDVTAVIIRFWMLLLETVNLFLKTLLM